MPTTTRASDSETFVINQGLLLQPRSPAPRPVRHLLRLPADALLGIGTDGAGGLDQSLTVELHATTRMPATAHGSASFAGECQPQSSSQRLRDLRDQLRPPLQPRSPAPALRPPHDGSPHMPCSASVTGAGGLNQSDTVDYTRTTRMPAPRRPRPPRRRRQSDNSRRRLRDLP